MPWLGLHQDQLFSCMQVRDPRPREWSTHYHEPKHEGDSVLQVINLLQGAEKKNQFLYVLHYEWMN